MAATSPYDEAHLFVAAVRLLLHRKPAPPSVEDIAELTGRSREWALYTARRLRDLGIVTMVEDPFTIKVDIADHTLIESIPKEQPADAGLGAEIEKFRKSREDSTKKVEGIKAELEKKKQDLFASLSQQLKTQKGNDQGGSGGS
ncbi:MAG: hypothetical protein AB1568_02335 [Thermodesulfobacteriota bacterium]